MRKVSEAVMPPPPGLAFGEPDECGCLVDKPANRSNSWMKNWASTSRRCRRLAALACLHGLIAAAMSCLSATRNAVIVCLSGGAVITKNAIANSVAAEAVNFFEVGVILSFCYFSGSHKRILSGRSRWFS